MSRRKQAWGAPLTRMGSVLRWTIRLVLIALIADLFYLALTWPDWKKLAAGPVPKSNFILEYEASRAHDRRLPALRWQPVPYASLPKHLVRAAILAEDSRFYQHHGFDLIAFKEAMNHNLAEGRVVLGASTISQQTVKNLFLSSSRNPLRKWHELVLTWGMERSLSKRRILEIYLNVAEFGTGVYGAQAAAQVYWGVPLREITVVQAAALVATLPSPAKNNPITGTPQFERRANKILDLLLRYPGDAAETVRAEFAPRPEPPPDEPDRVGNTI
mgnify:CR=1 FL=1